jgi:acyl-CoA thioesterase FadM
MDYALWRTDAPDELCARGDSIIVTLDYTKMQKVRVPDALRRAIGELEGWKPTR